MQKKVYFIYAGVLLYLLLLASAVPLSAAHDIYPVGGNPWLLTWNEFLTWHGRMLTGVMIRYLLLWGNPYVYFYKALLIFSVYLCAIKSIEPSFPQNRCSFFLSSIFIFIATIFHTTTFYGLILYDTANLYTYYITALFMLLFLQPYFRIFQKDSFKPNFYLFFLIAFLAGASHEQALVLLPVLLLMYLILKIKNIVVPSWYWLSVPFFLLGFCSIAISPGNAVRLESYGDAKNWEFMGQTLNWLDLGWKRYFYALFRHLFLTGTPWYGAPGYLPSTWHLQLIFLVFLALNIRKYRSFWDNHVLFPLLYIIISWGTCIIMAASPLYHSIPVEFSKFFIYVGLTQAIYYQVKDNSSKLLGRIGFCLIAIIMLGQIIQFSSLVKAKKEYLALEEAIKSGEVTEAALPRATLWGIEITRFGAILPIKYPHFKVIE